MAKASKKSDTKVTRITAKDSTAKKTAKPAKKPANAASAVKVTLSDRPKRRVNLGPLGRVATYFKGAWYELRQVRWPDRKATWGMTGALLAFTAFFVVIILLLDAGFSYLFKLIIGTN
jgi:preprotein translocase SecE subunit